MLFMSFEWSQYELLLEAEFSCYILLNTFWNSHLISRQINSVNNLHGWVDNSRVSCLVFKGSLLVELNQGIMFLQEDISLVSRDMISKHRTS